MGEVRKISDARTLVTRLVRESFGNDFISDAVIVEGGIFEKKPVIARRLEGIEGIARPYKKFVIFRYWERIGRFTNQEGSELTVTPEYEDKGREYARRYEGETGKPVRLTIMEG